MASVLLMSTGTKVGITVGVVVFILLFFKLIGSIIGLLLRHPIIFLLLLAFGGIGLWFNLMLVGAAIMAVIAGGAVMMFLGYFD